MIIESKGPYGPPNMKKMHMFSHCDPYYGELCGVVCMSPL